MLMDRYSLLQKIGLYFCIALFLIFMLLPFFEMFMTSLRPMQHLFRSPYQFWSDEFSFDAYRKMWVTVPLLGRYILNSIGIALTVTGLTMVVVIPAAYACARLAFPLRVVKMPEAELRNRVARAADILQLTEKLQLKPGQLSGGQRQRVAIGRSIVRAPKVFLFDEPLSNLDAALRGDMRVELSQLQRDLAATMIHVTHDQIEAMTMAHRIVVLNAGRVEQFGTPMELYHHPATRFVATFIGQPNMNLIPAKVLGTDAAGLAVELVGGTRLILPVDPGSARAGDRVEVGLRPENVTLGAGLSLKVRVLERLGGVSITYGALPNGERFCAALPGDAQVREGETINVSINPADCHVFDAAGQVMRRRMAPALAA